MPVKLTKSSLTELQVYRGPKRRFMLRMANRTPVKDVCGEPLYFVSKSEAKAYRETSMEDMVVSPGPDHRKW